MVKPLKEVMKWTKIAISDDINPIEECHEKTVMKNI